MLCKQSAQSNKLEALLGEPLITQPYLIRLKEDMFKQFIRTTHKFPREHIDLKVYATRQENDYAQVMLSKERPGIRPNSVFIGAVGTLWSEGTWQKVVDMLHYTNEKGVCCWLEEFPDRRVTPPYGAINTQRDLACLSAHDRGFDWVLLIDTDILPQKTLLLDLISWGMPVIVPRMIDRKNNFELFAPSTKMNMGVKPVWWSVFSCILISTKVLNCFPGCTPFVGMLLEDEFSAKLWHYGHRVYQDTNTNLELCKSPNYGGGVPSMKEQAERMEAVDELRKQPPNRHSLNPSDTRDIYLPPTWSVEGEPEIVVGGK